MVYRHCLKNINIITNEQSNVTVDWAPRVLWLPYGFYDENFNDCTRIKIPYTYTYFMQISQIFVTSIKYKIYKNRIFWNYFSELKTYFIFSRKLYFDLVYRTDYDFTR